MYKAEDIINYKKSQIEKEKKDNTSVKDTHKIRNFINKVCRVGFGICGGLLVLGGMPGVGAAFLSTAAFNHIALKNRGKIENNKIQCLTREEEHIEKISKQPINGSKEMIAKRKRKVKELAARKEQTASKRKWANFGHGLSTLFQWGALTAAVCVPATWWVSGLSLAAKYYTSNKKIETAQEDDMLALRLNNLNLDLELTNSIEPTPRAAATTKEEQVVEETNDKVEEKTYSEEDEKLVDAYISSLENVPQTEKAKQYTK